MAAAQDGLALGLAHAAPNAVGLRNAQGVLAALFEHGAGVADSLCAVLTLGACAAAFPVWVVEDLRCFATARAMQLPVPEIRVRTGEIVRQGQGGRDAF